MNCIIMHTYIHSNCLSTETTGSLKSHFHGYGVFYIRGIYLFFSYNVYGFILVIPEKNSQDNTAVR